MTKTRQDRTTSASAKRVDTGELVCVPAGELLGVVAGIPLNLAVLAYPKASDSLKREKFMEAMDAWRRKCCIQHVQSPGILMPSGRVRNLHGPISKGFRCLARRLSAGSMAWTIVVNKARNDWFSPASEQNGYGPSTVNSAAQALVLSRMKSTPGLVAEDAAVNIKHRIWAESLPVLHLAIALYQRIETLGLDGSDDDKLLLLLFRTDWLLPTLLYAESLRTFLPSRIPTFHPDKAVRLLPAS